MPFTIPTFPLTCEVWNLADNETAASALARSPDQSGVPCQLSYPNRLLTWPFAPNVTVESLPEVIIRFPWGTIIRDGTYNTSSSARGFGDIVAFTGDTAKKYGIVLKQHPGAGYSNHHLRCLAIAITPDTIGTPELPPHP